MQRNPLIFLALFVYLVAPQSAWSQKDNPYQLTGNISAGGVVIGGSYQVGVALGQPNAGEASGGGYTVGGGFFGGGQVTQPQPIQLFVYLPLLRR